MRLLFSFTLIVIYYTQRGILNEVTLRCYTIFASRADFSLCEHRAENVCQTDIVRIFSIVLLHGSVSICKKKGFSPSINTGWE